MKINGFYNEYGIEYPVPGFRNLPWHFDSSTLESKYTARFKVFKKWAECLVRPLLHHLQGVVTG